MVYMGTLYYGLLEQQDLSSLYTVDEALTRCHVL